VNDDVVKMLECIHDKNAKAVAVVQAAGGSGFLVDHTIVTNRMLAEVLLWIGLDEVARMERKMAASVN